MPSTRYSLQKASSPHPSNPHTRAFLRKHHSFCLLACLCSQEQGRDRGKNRLQTCFILVLGWAPNWARESGNPSASLSADRAMRQQNICYLLTRTKHWNLEALLPFPVFEWWIIWSPSVVLPLNTINFASFLSYFCKTWVNFWTMPRSVITTLKRSTLYKIHIFLTKPSWP